MSLQEGGGGADGAEEDFLTALDCTVAAAGVMPVVAGCLPSRGQRPWQAVGGWGGPGVGGGADAAHVSPGGARITLWEDVEEGMDDGGEGCEGGEAEEEQHGGARLANGCGGALGQQEWEEEGGEEVWEDGAGRWSHLAERSSSSSTGSFKSAGRAAAAAAAAAANLPIRSLQPAQPQRRPSPEARDSEANGARPRAAVQPTPTGGPHQHPQHQRDAPAWLRNARNSASSPSAAVRPASATAAPAAAPPPPRSYNATAYYHSAGLAAVGLSPTASPQRYPPPAAALGFHSSAPRFTLASPDTPLTAAPSDASCPTSSRWSASSHTTSGSTVRNPYLVRHASASSALSGGGTAGSGRGGSATAGGGYPYSFAYGYGHPVGNGGSASTGFAAGVTGAAGARSKSYHFGSGGPQAAPTAAAVGRTVPHTAWGQTVPRGPGMGLGLRVTAVHEEGPGSGSSAVVPSSTEPATDVEADLLDLTARANCQPASFTYGTTDINSLAAPGSVAWWGRRSSLGAAPAVDTWLLQQYAQQAAVQQQQQQSPWDAAATAAAAISQVPCTSTTPPLSPLPCPAQAATQRAPASAATPAAAVAAAAAAGPHGGGSPGVPAPGPFLPASASSLSTLDMISAVDWSVGQAARPAAPLVPPSPPSPLLLPGTAHAFHSEPPGRTAGRGPGLAPADSDAHAAASQSQGSGMEGSATEEDILHIFAQLLLQSQQQQQAGPDAHAPQLPPPLLQPAVRATAPPGRPDASGQAGYAAGPAATSNGSHSGRACAAAGSDPQPWLMLPGVTTAAVSQHGLGDAAAWMGTKQQASAHNRSMHSQASQWEQQQQRGPRPLRPASQPQTAAAAAAALAGAGHPAFTGAWLQPPRADSRVHSQPQLQGQVVVLRHQPQQHQQQQQAYHQLVQAQAAQLAQYQQQQQQRVRQGGLVTVQRPPAGVLGRRMSAADAAAFYSSAVGGGGLGSGNVSNGVALAYPAGALTPRKAGAGW